VSNEHILIFRVGDEPFPIPARIQEVVESPHTGKSLRRLSSEVSVPAARARAITALLATPRLVDADGSEWSGRLELESFGEVQGLHTLRILWEELEHLQASAVEFQGLSLHPSKYEERVEDRGVVISFHARLTAAETDQVRQLQWNLKRDSAMYFPVVRHGISDEPRPMRFGRVLWQALEDGSTDHQITLVDESLDDQPPSPFALIGEPQTGHLLSAVEQLLVERDALMEALMGAGALDEETIDGIREAGVDARGSRRYRFYQVDDLSHWE
jgi:hypothetical protein